MLKKLTYQEIGKKPHWIYEYSMVKGLLRVIRTESKGKKISYDVHITESDNERRIITSEYRLIDTGESFGIIHCERDKEGKLVKENFTCNQKKRIDYLDETGRYLKMEFFDEDNLMSTIKYIH